ncbi:TetR/AcrR family transcriptional regulator [Flavitalea flava]
MVTKAGTKATVAKAPDAKATEMSVRDHIVETACRLFYTQGYNLTGINQIIEEAGVAKASLYYHFPSKEDLCVEYLKQRYRVFWCGKLEEYLEGMTDAASRILRTFQCRADFMLDTNYGGCAYIRIIAELPQGNEKIRAQVRLQKDKQRKFFLDEVKNIKGIDAGQAQDLADTLFLLYDGAVMQCQLYEKLWPIDNAVKAVKKLLA